MTDDAGGVLDPGGHLASTAADCVHCGFCLPACPTYQLWGEEMDSPPPRPSGGCAGSFPRATGVIRSLPRNGRAPSGAPDRTGP